MINIDAKNISDEENPIDGFYGFARIYSGTIRRGDKINIIGLKGVEQTVI